MMIVLSGRPDELIQEQDYAALGRVPEFANILARPFASGYIIMNTKRRARRCCSAKLETAANLKKINEKKFAVTPDLPALLRC